MPNRETTSPPFTDLQRVEAQCDQRHTVSQQQHNKSNARLQQLFGDDSTKTPGVLNALQKGQEDLDKGLKEVKVEVQGLKIKLAVIMSVITILVQLGYHYITK